MGYHWTLVFFNAVLNLDLNRSSFCRLGDVWWIHGLGVVVKCRAGCCVRTGQLCGRRRPHDIEVFVVADRRNRTEACGLAILTNRRLWKFSYRQRVHVKKLGGVGRESTWIRRHAGEVRNIDIGSRTKGNTEDADYILRSLATRYGV